MSSKITLITIFLAYYSVHNCRAGAVSWDGVTCPIEIREDKAKENLHVFAPTYQPAGYTILAQNVTGQFSIAPNGTLSSATMLDYESNMKGYILNIVAFKVNDMPPNATKTCEIRVVDVNDEKPLFLKKLYALNIPNVAKGDSVLNVTATDKDVTATYNNVVYSIKAGNDTANFIIDGDTGNIKAAHSITGPHTFKITVLATDSNKADFTDETSVSICIGCASGSPSFEISMFTFMSLVFTAVLM